MGRPELKRIDEIAPSALVVTVSSVGAPAGEDRYLEPADYLRSMQMMIETLGCKPGAIITNENGAAATVNGWLQSAALGIPVLDAPCNGRAHPTGVMGSIGLHKLADYESVQCAAGGDKLRSRRVEIVARGSLFSSAAMVRQAAVQAGGLVAVARNPVSAEYVSRHAAIGAVTQALELGRLMLDKPDEARVDAAARFLNASSLVRGRCAEFELVTQEGFDVGKAIVECADGGHYSLTFWNEYMTLDGPQGRVGTFPDLIMTLRPDGMPVITAEMERGAELEIIVVNRENLILGAGMRDSALFEPVERAIALPVIQYVF
jgi:hypothetical protein